MIEKLWFLIPEMILFAGVIVVSIMGLSHHRTWRDGVPYATMFFLLIAAVVTPFLYIENRIEEAELLIPMMGWYIKPVICGMAILLVLTKIGLIDRRYEADLKVGKLAFDPMRVNRGEFFIFLLLSVIGVTLVCNANDLIWLFLALELTSLPTYIMVAISRQRRLAQEAAVKYFFLGAMSTAVFIYGFALLYGSTGTMVLTEMRTAFAEQIADGGINTLGIAGIIISLLGITFKIAGAPLHFYAADVYEGAASSVAAFIAFVPKAAGFLAMMLLLATIGWVGHAGEGVFGLPEPVLYTLWMIAVLTMVLGNVAALLQSSVKRMLAYSSVAHSGYMIIGLIAGPGTGLNSVLFYLTAYGFMNTAAFAVLAGLERQGQEIESVVDLRGLRLKHPLMAVALAISSASLLGVPPLLGFLGKVYLVLGGIEAGQIALVVILMLTTAISAGYYLYLIYLVLLAEPSPQAETIERGPSAWPRIAAVIGSAAVVIVPIFTGALYDASARATEGYVLEEEEAVISPVADARSTIEDD